MNVKFFTNAPGWYIVEQYMSSVCTDGQIINILGTCCSNGPSGFVWTLLCYGHWPRKIVQHFMSYDSKIHRECYFVLQIIFHSNVPLTKSKITFYINLLTLVEGGKRSHNNRQSLFLKHSCFSSLIFSTSKNITFPVLITKPATSKLMQYAF